MGRLPGTPPAIPGFHFLAPLGTGGFADVHLYEQSMPRRKVAVKVLHGDTISKETLATFTREADAMAALSTHPSILTIYQASVSSDGRPYLVLEYCKESMGGRYRNEYLPVDEVVSVGIRVGAALETVHRSGMLHRDIKPSNLLINEYGRPLLSDFGIVGGRGEQAGENIALSVPWSAPEVVAGESTGSIATEVWSLGATLYALLAGRSPFEGLDGQSNTEEAVKKRIRKAKYTPTGRADVPQALEAVLAKSMAPKPEDRYRSVGQMVQDLRAIEAGSRWPVTEYQLAGGTGVLSFDDYAADPQRMGLPVRSSVAVQSGRRRVSRDTQSASMPSMANSRSSEASGLTKGQVWGIVAAAVSATAGVAVALMMWMGG